jgi:hypothetical protein
MSNPKYTREEAENRVSRDIDDLRMDVESLVESDLKEHFLKLGYKTIDEETLMKLIQSAWYEVL